MKIKNIVDKNFHALTHKDFRYYWTGQCISLIGTWMQSVGQSWLVLSITKSPFLLGLIGTIQFLPVMFLSLFAGTLVDRFPKKKILIFTQTISMLLALILSILVFSSKIKYWHIVLLALILGFVNTLDMPTRQSFAVEVVGKEDLMNAIALNSAVFNLARVLGPAIGGIMMAYLGAAWCFLLNGLSYIAVIIGLFKISSKPYVRKEQNKNVLKDIGEGIKYIFNTKLLLQSIILILIVGIFIFNFNVLIPVYTKNTLHMEEKAYGFLLSCLGAGSFCGAMAVTFKSKKGPKVKVMYLSAIMTSIFLVLIGITKSYYISALFLFMAGIFNINFSTNANSTLQMNSKDQYRGRVMSVYSLVFAGATPIGNMFAGTTSDKLGANISFFLSGAITLICIGILFLFINLNKKSAKN